MRHPRALIPMLILLAACTDLSVDNPTQLTSGLRVINGTAGSVAVHVDGVAVATGLGQATLSAAVGLPAGTHTVEVTRSGVAAYPRVITVASDAITTVVALDSAGGITSTALSDTNAIVPAGATKLRVAHMASLAAPVSIWRTQPDFASPTRVQFPFPYRAVSPYLQSTPGDWRVMVSSEDNTLGSVPMPDTLANSGLITLADGASATVVIVDVPGGGVGFLVVNP
jgi:hypothetical protein